jgi:hypothetical protein
MRSVSVTAPSRLHFGLWSLASAAGRQFGGVGAMIDEPGIRLVINPAAELSATGPLAGRALELPTAGLHFSSERCRVVALKLFPHRPIMWALIRNAVRVGIAAGLNVLHELQSKRHKTGE